MFKIENVKPKHAADIDYGINIVNIDNNCGWKKMKTLRPQKLLFSTSIDVRGRGVRCIRVVYIFSLKIR